MNDSKKCLRICSVIMLFLVILLPKLYAFEQDDYTQVITKRAQKIVDKLNLNDAKRLAVRTIIVRQYRDLNTIHTELEQKEQSYKASLAKEDAKLQSEKAYEIAQAKLAKLHGKYLKRLGKELNEEQIEQVKNEMTYNVLPITYKGYLDMLPSLTETQKAQILSYLTEAREKAMDAGSSEAKHAWFGKYKGKINNYLSKEGVETKIARQVWEKKLKEKQQSQRN
ncbi:DUF3826 domain-containing protein [Olivibacter sp. 47]|uniref:DUF3826 domain-containing protein n=1 Tax=Sphingobacterium sp. (strain 21) TaxID=743722 RepID=F4CDA3_SPHS2|nr:DUF3826 domain-containing protein [Olivibacter sp. 47]MDM8176085.1 DUF3826 domain-containing protein [Olivibacter sp. 47]